MSPLTLLLNLTSRCLVMVMVLGTLSPELRAQEDEDDFFIFDEEEDDSPIIADPLESINRVTFTFNDKLYRGVLKPVARGLRILPQPVLNSGANFMDNLGAPISAISALFQFDLPNTATEASRFAINSTLGILGLFDPATAMGIAQDEEDMGQTLASYGIGHGFYLVIPFFGASSLRDFTGLALNAGINPIYEEMHNDAVIALNVVEAEFALALDQDTYEAFYDSALDPYSFFRSAYVQNRAGRVDR